MRPLCKPAESATAAGLRYVSDARLRGIRRIRRGHGYRYIGPSGIPLRGASVLARIRSLSIPPAWTDVWICPIANGHLQATGRDARRRKQYRYHRSWSAVRNGTKFERMLEFGGALPGIRRRVAVDLGREGLPREKVVAAVVRLLERSLIRVGCEEYARENDAYGLATMLGRHVRIVGHRIRFRFRGKSGRKHDIEVLDPCVAKIVRRCMELPGRDLFQYIDSEGARQRIDSGDVNDYLRAIAGEYTAKDFRTWGATLLAAVALGNTPWPNSAAARRRAVVRAIRWVADCLGNTANVCRSHYVNPLVIDAFGEGRLQRAFRPGALRLAPPNGRDASSVAARRLAECERVLLALLRATPEEPAQAAA